MKIKMSSKNRNSATSYLLAFRWYEWMFPLEHPNVETGKGFLVIVLFLFLSLLVLWDEGTFENEFLIKLPIVYYSNLQ